MPIKERVDIPKGQPGYISKAEIAECLKTRFRKEYTASQLKKLKREDLIAEYLKYDKTSEKNAEGLYRAAKRRKSFKDTLNSTFSRFRY